MAHDVQVIAALAAAIACEGYEFADDESYLELATAMRTHAVAARAALAEGNYESARQAVGEIGKSCASCHESYRN
jgi:cytochrome c556